MLRDLLTNQVLICGLVAWWLAQFLKVPIQYLVDRKWNWALMFSSGGMPSSHSALMVSTTLAIGLYSGFDTPTFAIAVAMSMIVIYDAAGVRRQAGLQAEKLNILIQELFSGHPVSEELLKEVIGHTPRQVVAGIMLGFMVTLVIWWIYPPIL